MPLGIFLDVRFTQKAIKSILAYVLKIGTLTDKNISGNFLRVVNYLNLVANLLHETFKNNVLQVNSIVALLIFVGMKI